MRQVTRSTVRKGVLFLRLTRPIFLAGGVLLYAFGAVTASAAGFPIDWRKYLLGQLLVTITQLFAQYSNEYFDRDVDRLNTNGRTWFSGGSGVLPSGEILEHTAFLAVRLTGITAMAIAFGLSFDEPLVSLIGFLAIAGSWFYSAPPLSLVGSGFGEFFASAIVCVLVPFTAAIIQTDGPLPVGLLAILPLFFIHAGMLIVFSLPDYDADRQAGKATLAVRFGLLLSSRWHSRLIVTGFALLGVLSILSLFSIRFTWIALPIALWQGKEVSEYARAPSDHPHRLTLGAVGLFAMTTGLLILDFVIENGIAMTQLTMRSFGGGAPWP